MTDGGRSLWSSLLAALFLIGLPGCFGFFLLDHLETKAQIEARRAEHDDIREVLGQIATRGNLQRRFGQLFDRLVQLPWSTRAFAARAARIQRANRSIIEIYLFDATAVRTPLPGCRNGLVIASQQFLEALINPGKPPRDKMIKAFAGNTGAPALMMAAPGTLVELMNGDTRTWGGWWRLHARNGTCSGHVIVFVHRQAIRPDRLIDQAIGETNRWVRDRFICGWRDPMHPDTLRPRGQSLPAGLGACLNSLSAGQSAVQWRGLSVAIHPHEDGVLLFGVSRQPLRNATDFSRYRRQLGLALLVGWILISFNIYRLQSLHAKLVWLLAVAGGFPLAVFLSTVYVDRQDREALTERRINEEHMEFLTELDGNFSTQFLPILRQYRRTCARIAVDSEARVALHARSIRALMRRQKGLITKAVLVDSQGRTQLLANYLRGGDDRNVGSVPDSAPPLALGILQNVNGVANASTTTPGGNPIIGMMAHSKFGFQWVGEDDSLRSNQFGTETVQSYLRLFRGADGQCNRIFIAFHDNRKAQTRYLRRMIGTRHQLRRQHTRLLAVPVIPGGSWPAFPDETLAGNPSIRKIRELVMTSGLPQHQTVSLNDGSYLVSALRGHYLDGYVLIMAFPSASINAQTRQLSQRAWSVAAVMLLATMIVAWFTGSLLLAPLDRLKTGLVAIEKHDFRHHIEHGAIRELAHVAHRFNLVLADLAELKMARSVQETLWPGHGLATPHWQVDGRCITAAALGGDFYDWFVLADGRLVMAIGDVAGHGIPSALVAAAAKVELAMNAEIDAEPSKILEAMNTGLSMQAGRKRPMTFWVGVFDPATGILKHASAGQCYPVALVRAAAPTMIEGHGYPLGSRKRGTFHGGTTDLSRGGRICLYSDGLVEARNPHQERSGYPRLTAAFERTRGLSIELTLSEVLAEVQEWSGLPVPEDDQTLLMLDIEARS